MDIFISYRRDTGRTQAALIKSELEKRNIDVFLDTNSIHNEDFWEKIKKSIDMCPNFLMMITPGYFVKRDDSEDYVRKEMLYAKERGKNIIAIMSSKYNPDEVDWNAEENAEIKEFETYNYYKYTHGSDAIVQTFYESAIIRNMVDHKGKRFSTKKKLQTNSWYSNHEMTEADTIWIKTDHVVCRELDWEILEKAITEEKIFGEKKDLKLLCYKAYDIPTYKRKYDLRPRKTGEPELETKITDVYGICYSGNLDEAIKTFGEGHFLDDKFEEGETYFSRIEDIMRDNDIEGFDIIDLTLVIKDNESPEKTIRHLSKYLSREGGIIYIRELDDDYIDMYPDEKQILKKLKYYLTLDKGAGNRHTGKKVYTFLKRSGAKKVYLSDKIISSANYDSNFHGAMFMNYFSYLQPEFEALVDETDESDPNYRKYEDALFWINENFDSIESMFRAPDLYFRAGYVAGYAVYHRNDYELY